jgi:hypothetical protein
MRFEQYDDAVYAHTDYLQWLEKYGEQSAEAWLWDRRQRYGDQAFVPSAVAWHHALLDARDTDILWMTNEMMDLCQVAMRDFDPAEPVTMDDIFLPSGFLVLPHAFMGLDANGKKLGWRIIYWRTVDHLISWEGEGEGARFSYNTQMEGIPEAGIRFMQISYSQDEDDFYLPHLAEALKVRGLNWGVSHATAIPLSYMSNRREITGEGDRNADWLLFWRVMQKLMSERIVLSEQRLPGRPARRNAQRFAYPPPVLRVIELRRPRKARTEDDEHGEGQAAREYSHRWIVRGHWRNQACGPGHSLRKQRWISAYEKGPEDLDLVIKTRVWNWDR